MTETVNPHASAGRLSAASTQSGLRLSRIILLTAVFLLVSACTNIAYYAQAVAGQVRLIAASRPNSAVLADGTIDPALRRQIEQAAAIRAFASSELALPHNDSYRSYADLGRPYVVWNVFATPELSVDAQQWCLIFIGCVKYRGYYDKREAELYAEELRQVGADTYVGGVIAYSTLGYFNDPLLNTFLHLGDMNVARIIFHELAHQVVYVNGDSDFNESFATTVELEGTRRWLRQSGQSARLQEMEMEQVRKVQFHRLVSDVRAQLREIYASSLAIDAKRSAKAEALAEMRRTYTALKASLGNTAALDHWPSQALNNAALNSIVLYAQWVPAFDALLALEGGDLSRFYQRVAALARLPQAERTTALERLMAARPKAPA